MTFDMGKVKYSQNSPSYLLGEEVNPPPLLFFYPNPVSSGPNRDARRLPRRMTASGRSRENPQ